MLCIHAGRHFWCKTSGKRSEHHEKSETWTYYTSGGSLWTPKVREKKKVFCFTLLFPLKRTQLCYCEPNHTTAYAAGLCWQRFSCLISEIRNVHTVCVCCAILQRMYLVTELCARRRSKRSPAERTSTSLRRRPKHIIKAYLKLLFILHKKGNAHKTQTPPKIAHIFKSHAMAWIPLFPYIR